MTALLRERFFHIIRPIFRFVKGVFIKNAVKFKDEYVRKHITNDLISSIHNWKNTRNTLNHDLINCEYTSYRCQWPVGQ